jgi:uncharacterized lipoprotein YddW (UPF0748 family)
MKSSAWQARLVLRSLCVAGLVFLLGCAGTQLAVAPVLDEPPAAPRELRAAWVATVANIDWPSRAGLPVAQQQAEIKALLDQAKALNLNAIVLQVRPGADALYPSGLEPWSEYLTGEQGRAPEPFYDPLQMWIEEAHRRGIELHAWLNPYRARHASARSPLAANHLARTDPQAVKSYGEQLWMDPAEPVAVQRTLDVVADLAHRYDMDAIHIDDYFYPYPIAAASGGEIDFPDEAAWQRYRAAGGQLTRADWRRAQVNRLIEQMQVVIHHEKPWLRFGISPFGLGRPERRPAGITGFSQYDKLYADVELWLQNGWLDYLAPQLYWPIGQTPQAFPVLLANWVRENTQKRHLWSGIFTSRIDDSAKSWAPREIENQITLTRAQDGSSGHVHFSMIALLQDRQGLARLLKNGVYATQALVPATPWLGAEQPAAPRLVLQRAADPGRADVVRIESESTGDSERFAVWKKFGTQWLFTVQAASQSELLLQPDPLLGKPDAVVVSRVNRLGVESARTRLQLQP